MRMPVASRSRAYVIVLLGLLGGMLAALMGTGALAGTSGSVYLQAPSDPQAIVVKARGDGKTDDTGAIQAALDQARNKGAGGIVFLPSGHYRVSRTLFLWPSVRLFGVGASRPVLLLGDRTPGFQSGIAAMVAFTGEGQVPAFPSTFPMQGSVPYDPKIADGNPDTFYSVISNIDIEIGKGNAGAVGVRFHPAQHSFLTHMNFRTGSGLAGVYMVGNEADDLHFFGGKYGILTEKSSPAWQFAVVDSSFDGQSVAAIREHEAGLTLINTVFRNTPIAIEIDKGYGDWLWGKDIRLENISNAAVVISNENNVYTQVGFENAIARNVPVFARFRDSGKTTAGPSGAYRVKSFTHGLIVSGLGQMGHFDTLIDSETLASLPSEGASALPALPPVRDWVDVRTFGAKGDDVTDDTTALQRAIASARVLYFPIGRYKVSDTLLLKPDTVLIGLHSGLTQIILKEEAPAFVGVGAPKALIETPKGGPNIVTGLGLYTGGINPRATAVLWRSGAASFFSDVKLLGGHGTFQADGTRYSPYNANHSSDPDPHRRWDGQYPSVWVTDGGGGTFFGIWSADTFAQSGLLVSNTSTPGHVYDFSNEHHVRQEMVLDKVSNWEFLNFQSEEEAGESSEAVSLEIHDSSNLLITNYHGYRVTRTAKPALAAVKIFNSSGIRFRNVHVNAESGFAACDDKGCGTFLRPSHYPFENAIVDVTSGLQVREREFASLDISTAPAAVAPSTFEGARVDRIGEGFYALLSPTVDQAGRLYFVDRHDHRIYRWTPENKLEVIRDNPLDPMQIVCDRSGNLMVLSSQGADGTVYSIQPDGPATELTLIKASPAPAQTDAAVVMPVNWWVNGEFKDQIDPTTYRYPTLRDLFTKSAAEPKTEAYVSPDGSLVLPAFRVFQQGPLDYTGWRWSQTLVASGLISGKLGDRVLVTNQSENITYSGRLARNGTLIDLRPFANRGGESVAVDKSGRAFVANGQIFVYDANSLELGRIDLPERPIGLVFGGRDGRTLYALSQHSVFAISW